MYLQDNADKMCVINTQVGCSFNISDIEIKYALKCGVLSNDKLVTGKYVTQNLNAFEF